MWLFKSLQVTFKIASVPPVPQQPAQSVGTHPGVCPQASAKGGVKHETVWEESSWGNPMTKKDPCANVLQEHYFGLGPAPYNLKNQQNLVYTPKIAEQMGSSGQTPEQPVSELSATPFLPS